MRTYIKKLQTKKEDTRKQILVLSLVVCMSFVGLVWINSLGYKFNKDDSAKTEEGMKPFALFKQTISDTYKGVTASVGNIKSIKEDPSTETENKEENVKIEKQIDLIPVEKQ